MKTSRRFLAMLLVVMMIVGTININASAATKKKGVKISNVSTSVLVIKKGKTYKLKTKVTGTKSQKVSYKSSKKSVATVSKAGKITAKKKGTTKITITSKANKKLKKKLTVKVGTPIKSVKVNKKSVTLEEGKTFTIKAKASNKKATYKKFSYKSSNKKVATVTKSGKIKAVKAGTAKITVTAKDGSKKKATVKVTVKAKKAEATTQKPTEQPTTETGKTEEPTEEPTEEDPDQPEKPETLSMEGYSLKWEDNFDGTELNRADWNVEIHEPGWVNAELQEYVDTTDNIYVEDGNLVLMPKMDETGHITSGRVNTQGKHDFTYGLFEASVKVPAGKGYLPAFWMMPTNESLYGQWPVCGEIDIMEVMGQDTKKAMGTIHYGKPHNESQGSYTLTKGDFASEYHKFSVEWKPGSIKWYVDGVLFHQENRWYSSADGENKNTYPAPFDQPFYMILNNAVGGSWVGYPEGFEKTNDGSLPKWDGQTKLNEQPLIVDYVKVYQLDEYDENVTAPEEKPVSYKEADATGNFVTNGDFSEAIGEDPNWVFSTAAEGVGSAEVKNGEVVIKTENAGTEEHSIQLLQRNMPVKKGYQYKLSFTARADEERTMVANIDGGASTEWKRYVQEKVTLTTEPQKYELTFAMDMKSNPEAICEFNLGNQGSTATAYISDVRFEIIGGEEDVTENKGIRADGNYVYNGAFQEGVGYLGSWDVEVPEGVTAKTGVTGIADGRRFCADVEGDKTAYVVLKQSGLALAPNSKYILTFDVQADESNPSSEMICLVDGYDNSYEVSTDKKTVTFKFETEDKVESDTIYFGFEAGKTYIDNIRLAEDALISNGSFNAGMAGWEFYADGSATAESIVDSQKDDNAVSVDIKNTGDQDWKIQLKQNTVSLVKDQWYELEFKVKTSMARSISYAIQRNGAVHKDSAGNEDWTPYVQEVISLPATTSEYTVVKKQFKMKQPNDEASIFNIAMGAVGGKIITDQHYVIIDDVSLKEIDEPVVDDKPTGDNIITDLQAVTNSGTTCSVEDGVATFDITEGTGANNWDIQYHQTDLAIESGATYKISFTIESSIDRAAKLGFRDPNQNYAGYYDDLKLTAGEALEYEVDYTADIDTTDSGEFVFLLGKPEDVKDGDGNVLIPSVDCGPHVVKISNVQVIKPAAEDDNIITALEAVTNSGTTCSVEDGVATIDVTESAGTNNWDIQYHQTDLAIENGATYKISFTINSNIDRVVKLGFRDPNQNYAGYYGDLKLTAGEALEYEADYTADIDTTDSGEFVFLLGKPEDVKDGDGNVLIPSMDLGPHTVTISDVKVVKTSGGAEIKDPSDEPGETPVEEYGVNKLSTTERTLVATGEEANSYECQHNEKISLVSGTKYVIKFKITSDKTRKIQYGLQKDGAAHGDDWGTLPGADVTRILEAGVEETIELEVTSGITDKDIFFFVNAGQAGADGNVVITEMEVIPVEG